MTYNVRVTKGQKETNTDRRKYDADFKQSALKMIHNGQSVRCVAQALGVAEGQLHRWQRDFKQTGPESEKEVAALRSKLRQVEMERDILKKALSIFSRQI
jgi:transposase